jgi:hypothetical protein
MGTIGISPSVITLWHFRRHSADGAGWREILRDAADKPQDLTNSDRRTNAQRFSNITSDASKVKPSRKTQSKTEGIAVLCTHVNKQ